MIKINTSDSSFFEKQDPIKNDFLFSLLCFFCFSLLGFSQSIQVNSVASNPACGGDLVTVTFRTTNGNGANNRYSSSTNFVVYLSSNTGGTPYSSLGALTLLPYTFSGGNGAINNNVQGTITLPANASGTYSVAIGSTGPDFSATGGSGASPNFTVNAAPNGGTVSGGTTVCSTTNNTVLTLSGHSGSVVKWQSSPVSDFSSSVTDIANTTTSLTVTNIPVTTYYRAVLSNGTCTSKSSVASIIVDLNSATVSSNQSICSGTQPANIVLTGSIGAVQWQSSTDNAIFSNISGATVATLSSAQMGALTVTKYYRAVVTGGCGTYNSPVVTVTVSSSTVGGTVSSDATVCSGNNSTVLTLSGYTGNVVKWQSSALQNFNSPVDIANTTNTLTVTNITSTTYYRAVVQSGGCASANSSHVKITVQNSPNGGSLSGSTTVCYGTNSTNLTVTGYTSNSIQKWQSSTVSDFSSGVTDIANTSATLTVTNLTATTYYRVVVVNANCTNYSTTATIAVNPMLSASIVSNNSPVCSGSNAIFNVSGTSGATLTYTINGGSNQTVLLAGGAATVTITGVASDQTLALVSVALSGCSQTISGSSTVTVNALPTASISGNNGPICSGSDAGFTLAGTSGATVTYTVNGGSNQTVVLAGGIATVTITGVPSNQTLALVSVALSGCSQTISGSSTVTVNALPTASISGNIGPICSGSDAGFTLTGTSGATVTYTVNGGSNQTVVLAGGAATVTITGVASNQTLALVSVALSGCSQAISGSSTVTVNALPTVSISGNNGPICSGSDAVFTLTGTSGATVTYTVNGGSNQTVVLSGGAATVMITGVASNQTLALVSVALSGCSQTISGSSTVTVNALPTVSISGNNGPICSGSDAVFTLTGTSGATVTYTVNGGSNQTVVLAGGTATVTITGVASNQTLALVSVALSGCSQAISGSSTVVVDVTNTWTGAVDSNWNTSGNWSCNAVPTSNTNVVINSGAVTVSGAPAFANTIDLNGTSTLIVTTGNNLTVTNAFSTAAGAVFTLQNNANLLQVNNVANSGSVVVNRESSALLRQDYTLWASPVAVQNLLAFSPQTLTSRFYVYNPATNTYVAIAPASNSFQTGKGYLIRMPDNWSSTTAAKWNGRYTGVPNNGNITLNLSNGGAGFGYNAIGNPYPSAVDMVSFVNGNSSTITGTLYFWRKTNNATTDPGYCTWTTAGFVSNGEAQVFNPNGILRTGQGFIVELASGQTTVNFSNKMRIADNANQFFKTVSSSTGLTGDKIWLTVANSSGSNSQMLLGYFNSATRGVDYGIDGKALGTPTVSLTSLLNNTDYTIQGRPTFDVADVVPLSFKTATNGQHTISISQLDGLFLGNQPVYLRDNLANTIHDLKAGSYTFNSNTGSYPSRFEIVYQNGVLNSASYDFKADNVVVYKENNSIEVKADGYVLDAVKVFDISGRLLTEKKAISTSETTLPLKEGNGILLVQVTTESGATISKKIVN